MFIDTHTHIYLDKFDDDIEEVIRRATDNGVNSLYLPNVDLSTAEQLKKLANAYPDICYPMMGLHPCSVGEDYIEQLDILRKELNNENYVAVGEIGIDLYWDKTYQKEQELAFRKQIEWSREMDIPFVIHSRDSLDLTISIVEEMQDGSLKGIFHCFNGTEEQVERIQDIGFYMGLGGVITYKNAKLDGMVAAMNIDNMVLETDAPYLSPVPYRGKRNEPAYIPGIAQKIANIRNVSVEEIAKYTTINAKKIFSQAD